MRKRRWILLACLSGLVAAATPQAQQQAPPDVLFIALDDLNDWVGVLGGHPQASTPHMDALAQRGTLFVNAHAQAPLCNPSRASLLTGLRPSTTGIYGLAPGIRAVPELASRTTLPQHFAAHGYFTASFGKIFHDGSIPQDQRAREFDVWGPAPGMPRPARKFVDTPDPNPLVDWGVFPERDAEQADAQIADAAIAQLASAPADRPLFLAVGFRLPHVPNYASAKWFDRLPETSVRLPPIKADDRADVPPFAWYLHWKLPEPRLDWMEKTGQLRPFVRAYLASTSYVDSEVGRVLAALAASPRGRRTIVVLWSDHGYHLGEKAITGKNSLWERSTRVPLIFAGPGIARGVSRQPVELLDLYPTLVELARLPPVAGLEGHSLMPQLRDARAPRPWPAITTHNQGNHAIRTAQWRFIRYADGSEELYDMRRDPHEWTNLASEARYKTVLDEHRRWLPTVDRPPVPGSRFRLLTRDGDGWTWEGERIDPTAAPDRK